MAMSILVRPREMTNVSNRQNFRTQCVFVHQAYQLEKALLSKLFVMPAFTIFIRRELSTQRH